MYAMDVFQGLMAASDHHGNVMLINHQGIMWKRKSEGEFGWMVSINTSLIQKRLHKIHTVPN